MVPRDSQQQPQLYEQLTWNSDEQLLNKWQKSYLEAKIAIFDPKRVQNKSNKTQYDWFPGKSQNSKKFSAKFKQKPTTSKNHRVFLNILKSKFLTRFEPFFGPKMTIFAPK